MKKRLRSRVGLVVLALAVVASPLVGCTADPDELFTESYTLPAFNFEPVGTPGDQSNSSLRGLARPAGDIAVKRITWKLLDGEGQEIPPTSPDIHFHHVVLFSSKHPDAACPGGGSRLGGRWAAPGGERTPFALPSGYAYHANAADVWGATWHIMNLADRPQHDVRVEYTVTYARDRSTLRDVTPFWWDQAGCNSAGTITVPGTGTPAIYERSRAFTVRRGGFIKAVRSHMHDGGIDVTLRKADGTVVCVGAAVYQPVDPGGGHEHGGEHNHGGAEVLVAIPLCADLHVRVEAGERLTSTVRYHNDRAQSDAMGSNLVWIAEDAPPTPTTTGPPPAARV